MPVFPVQTAIQRYDAIVERGAIGRLAEFLPAKLGKIFVVSTGDVWDHHEKRFRTGLGDRAFHRLNFSGGEEQKRMAIVETWAEEMVELGADRSSLVIAFGGGIVTDLGGFLAAVFMRGIPLIQVPTTLLAQVDAGVGGKTGANLVAGKNLVGAFHQPLAVLVDPDVLSTLPEREYHAGLFEVLKCGVIRSEELFRLMAEHPGPILARSQDLLEKMIAESVRIKCEVVSADEREGGVRRILNFGHTVGHALEAETGYKRFLHGEAVGVGMKAATHLARLAGKLPSSEAERINAAIDLYGPVPSVAGISAAKLLSRLTKDKKTVRGAVHFVLPVRVGETEVVTGLEDALVLEAIQAALA
jgi:3-dehydroquinate synthase